MNIHVAMISMIKWWEAGWHVSRRTMRMLENLSAQSDPRHDDIPFRFQMSGMHNVARGFYKQSRFSTDSQTCMYKDV